MRRIDWLLKAQMNSCEYQGVTLYEPSCSLLHVLQNINNCGHCGARKFQYEPPTFCCYNGQIKLATVEVPGALKELFTSNSEQAIEFRKHIRAYNSIFSFTSFGVHLDKELASSRRGVYTFRAQGQIYHDLPPLVAEQNNPRYFQLYFYDTENEAQNRMRVLRDSNLNEVIVHKLMQILEANPYAQFLRRLKDLSLLDNFQINIVKDVRLDQRVYNSPSSDQVAAIWVEGNNPNVPLERDIVVHAHSGHRHRVRHYFGCYDPLQYPILFPNGEVRSHQNISRLDSQYHVMSGREVPINSSSTPNFTSAQNIFDVEVEDVARSSTRNVSCREYYSYKLQIRDNGQSMLLLTGRLLQQYAVDMYIKLETTRLDYYRRQQSKVRAELYQGIVDSVTSGETRGNQVGQRIILPASFVGGPRDMHHSPDWKEIQEELHEGQLPQDRPDLTSRVFRAKLEDLKDQLFKKEIFGKVATHVHAIEFQKRGLPHAHILLILKPGYKITTPNHFDKFVCAEIPDEREHPHLYGMKLKHMMHGPCGELDKNNPCMKKGACKNHYPRSFCSKTLQGTNAYPIYRISNDKRHVQVRGKMLDNRWVVPYNPYLLTRYNCHINVEICSDLKAVKYLYKYIYKGHDRVAVYIGSDNRENMTDEIQQFQDARWVSAQEAMWRIYEFNLNEMSPAVINLQLHLPNKQSICYWENQNLQHVLLWDHISRTMLTEFFSMCSNDDAMKNYLYKEFPEHYVWNKQNRSWQKRKKREVIGRVNGANPTEGERYYLRLLLNHVKGSTSFEDLLTVHGNQCSSFKESAQKRGLLESNDSILECLSEASTFQMPQALRRLFATILIFCEPSDIRKLWDEYFEAMSKDFKRIHGNSTDTQLLFTLNSINLFLESMGKSTKDYDLPLITPNPTVTESSYCRDITDEMVIEIPPTHYTASMSLNPEQNSACMAILERVSSDHSGIFFIDGPGGTGKTFLYCALLANIRTRGFIALATATSGVTAALMPGGRTAHSRFKIPIIANETSICNISKQSGTAELLHKSKLLIMDEAPMAKRFAIETLDRSLKDIMGTTVAFGGKVIVFGGDFRQVLPVVRRGTRAESVNASLVRSHLWPHMEILSLTQNMRARADMRFSEFLLRVGNGVEPKCINDVITIPDELVIKCDNDETAEMRLLDTIFPDLAQHAHSAEYITERAILATTNEHADSLNEKLIARFPGEGRIFASFDEAVDDTNNYYQEDFLNSLMPNGLPPHKMEFKINCPIMLLQNLDPSNGLCNGTRMVCRQFGDNVIHAEVTIGQHAGKQVLLPRIPLSPAENEGYPFQFRRKQFPI